MTPEKGVFVSQNHLQCSSCLPAWLSYSKMEGQLKYIEQTSNIRALKIKTMEIRKKEAKIKILNYGR